MCSIWTFESHTGLKLQTVQLKELLGRSLFVKVILLLHKETWVRTRNNFTLALLFDPLHTQMAFLSETLIGTDKAVFLLDENARCKFFYGDVYSSNRKELFSTKIIWIETKRVLCAKSETLWTLLQLAEEQLLFIPSTCSKFQYLLWSRMLTFSYSILLPNSKHFG